MRENAKNLLLAFYEDIITLEEKIHFTDVAVTKEIEGATKLDSFIINLKRTLNAQIEKFSNSFTKEFLETSNMLRRTSNSSGSTLPTPKQLDIQYIQNYLREKIGKEIHEVYRVFYKTTQSPNDAKLVSILTQILDLDSYFSNINDGNLMQKVDIDLIEISKLIFSNAARKDLIDSTQNILKLNMKYIYEFVLKLGGGFKGESIYQSLASSMSGGLSNKDKQIDKVFALYNSQPQTGHINVASLVSQQLTRKQQDIKRELQYQLQKALSVSGMGEEERKGFKILDEKKISIFDKINTMKIQLSSLTHAYTGSYSYEDLVERDEKTAIANHLRFRSDEEMDHMKKISSTSNYTVYSDPQVSRVYNDVLKGEYTAAEINKSGDNTTAIRKFTEFERLTYATIGILSQIEQIFRDLEYFKQSEKACLKFIVNNVLAKVETSLNDKFYFNLDIFELIDDLFKQLEGVLSQQRVALPELETNRIKAIQLEHDIRSSKRTNEGKRLNVGLQRLSSNTGLSIIRLIHEPNSTIYDAYNVQQAITQFVKESSLKKNDPRFVPDKLIFYFMNDKSKYKTDFFKLYLFDGSSTDETLRVLELYHVDENTFFPEEKFGHEDYRFNQNSIPTSFVKDIDFKFAKVEVKYERSIQDFNIQSKLVLAIYQLLFKEIIVNLASLKDLEALSPIILTQDHVLDLKSYLTRVSIQNNVGRNVLDLAPANLKHLSDAEIGRNTYHRRLEEDKIRSEIEAVPQSRGIADNYWKLVKEKTMENEERKKKQNIFDGIKERIVTGGLPLDDMDRELLDQRLRQMSRYLSDIREFGDSSGDLWRKVCSILREFGASNTNDQVNIYNIVGNSAKQSQLSESEQANLLAKLKEYTNRLDTREPFDAKDTFMKIKDHFGGAPVDVDAIRTRQSRIVEEMERQKQENRRAQLLMEENARKYLKHNEEDNSYEKEGRKRGQPTPVKARHDKGPFDHNSTVKGGASIEELMQREINKGKEGEQKRLEEVRERRRREDEDRRIESEKRKERESKEREMRERDAERRRLEEEKRQKDREEQRLREADDRRVREEENERKKLADQKRNEQEEDKRRRLDDERREREKEERERREQRDREDRDRQEKLDREERDRREREDRERREKKEREDRERRDRDEHQRRERLDREEKEERDRQNRERKEKEDRERRDREERERLEREKDERREKEERERREREDRDKEQKQKQEREDREEQEQEKKRLEEEKRIQREKEEENLKKQKELEELEAKRQEQQQQQKQQEEDAQKVDIDDLNFDDDFDDNFDELDDNQGKEMTKKTDNMGESDFDDDFDDDFIEPEVEPKKEENIEEEAPTPNVMAGGIRGLRNRSQAKKKEEPAQSSKKPSYPTEYTKLLKEPHYESVLQSMQQISPLEEDFIHEYLGSVLPDGNFMMHLLQEFIKQQNCYPLEIQEGEQISGLYSQLEAGLPQTKPQIKEMGDQLAESIREVLVDSLQQDKFDTDINILVPIIPQLFDLHALFMLVVNIKKKKVIFAHLGESTAQQIKSDPRVVNFLQFIFDVCSKVLDPEMASPPKIIKNFIMVPKIGPELVDFLIESTQDPSFRYFVTCFLIYYEGSSEDYSIESLFSNFELEDFSFSNACRLVYTLDSIDKAEMILSNEQTLQMFEMAITQKLNSTKEAQIVNYTDEPDPTQSQSMSNMLSTVSKLVDSIGDHLKTKNRVFMGIRVMYDEVSSDGFIAAVYVDKKQAFILEMMPFNNQAHQSFSEILRERLVLIQPNIQLFKEFPRSMLSGFEINVLVCAMANLVVFEK